MKQAERFKVDFLQGSIMRSLLIFAIPVLISNIFQQFYNMADTMIVGNYLGESSLAAIGACTSIYDLLVGFALGIGNGLAVVTARYFGAGDTENLKKSVASSILIGLVFSLVISGVGCIVLKPLLELLNTPAEIIEESYSYISFIVMFTVVMFTYNLCAGFLRSVGNSLMPLVFLVIASVINVGLDILFIAELSMGIRGAAVATVIAQGISAALCLIYIWKKVPLLVPEKRHFMFEWELFFELLGQGISMGLMGSIVSVGSVILQYGINGLGTLIIAGHTAARKLYMFIGMPLGTMSAAIATFVSQNRGAGNRDRIRQVMKYGYVFNVVLAGIVTALMFVIARPLVQLISGSNEAVVLGNATLYLQVTGPFYAVLGTLLQTRGALQGIGEKVLPLISSVIECGGKILFVILFIPRFQYMAVIFCEPVIWCVMMVQLLVSFYRNPFIRGTDKKSGKSAKEIAFAVKK